MGFENIKLTGCDRQVLINATTLWIVYQSTQHMYVLRMQSHQLNNITGRDDGNDVVRGICDDDDGEQIHLTRGVFAKNERI